VKANPLPTPNDKHAAGHFMTPKRLMTSKLQMKEDPMTTKHLVDPELVAILDHIPATVLTTGNLGQIRAMSSQAPVKLGQFSALSVSEHIISGPEDASNLRVLVYHPTSVHEAVPVLLWLHGGGYIMGSADGEDLMVKSIVSAVGCATVSVDYRLAPETPYPGPVEDCYAALKSDCGWWQQRGCRAGCCIIALGARSWRIPFGVPIIDHAHAR